MENKIKGGKGKNVHWSLTLIGTPCSGPFKRPVAANSSSSLRASCLASSNNTIHRVHQARAQHLSLRPIFRDAGYTSYVPSVRQFVTCCAYAARAIYASNT